jgi:hypothetical protein
MEPGEIRAHILDTCPGTLVMTSGDDLFFVHDPDRDLPDERKQPWATLVHDDTYDRVSDLARPGVYRLNIGVRPETYRRLFGKAPTTRDAEWLLVFDPVPDLTVLDRLLPHPMYGNWLCILSPARLETVAPLLAEAHAQAVRKHANFAARRTT